MKIQKQVVVETPLAEQVAALIGKPAENICVKEHPDGSIEVSVGRADGGRWIETGDIPVAKRSIVAAWAQARQAAKA